MAPTQTESARDQFRRLTASVPRRPSNSNPDAPVFHAATGRFADEVEMFTVQGVLPPLDEAAFDQQTAAMQANDSHRLAGSKLAWRLENAADLVDRRARQKTWLQQHAGSVPGHWEDWRVALENVKSAPALNPDLKMAAATYPHWQVVTQLGASHRLPTHTLVKILARPRSEIPDFAKDKILEAQAQQGVSSAQIATAKNLAEQLAQRSPAPPEVDWQKQANALFENNLFRGGILPKPPIPSGPTSTRQSAYETDLAADKHIWQNRWAGFVPDTWGIWYNTIHDLEDAARAGVRLSPDLINAAVSHPDHRLAQTAAKTQPLTPEQLGSILARDIPDHTRNEIISHAGEHLSRDEIAAARDIAANFKAKYRHR